MLQIIEISGDNIIATRASGDLSEMDIEKVHPIIHAILDKGLNVTLVILTWRLLPAGISRPVGTI